MNIINFLIHFNKRIIVGGLVMINKFNLKGKVTASFILVLGLFLCFKLIQVSATNNIDREMKNEVSQKFQAWIEYYKSNDTILKSSSPYSYIENDKFEEIKNLSPEYLTYILREIENEPSAVFALWGLKGISKVKDLPKWDSDDQCVSIWNSYIENLPLKFNEIKKELYTTVDAEKIKLKTQEIVDLGYPALPLIMEEDNIKMEAVKEILFKQNSNENDEEKANKEIAHYKEVLKKNTKIKELESFKINREYK